MKNYLTQKSTGFCLTLLAAALSAVALAVYALQSCASVPVCLLIGSAVAVAALCLALTLLSGGKRLPSLAAPVCAALTLCAAAKGYASSLQIGYEFMSYTAAFARILALALFAGLTIAAAALFISATLLNAAEFARRGAREAEAAHLREDRGRYAARAAVHAQF